MGFGDTMAGYGNKTWDWLSNGQNLQGLGALVGGAGQAYAGYEQSKAAEKMLDMQKQSFNEELQRRKKTQLALDNAFGTSTDPLVPRLNLGTTTGA